MSKSRSNLCRDAERGDFQTPIDLARRIWEVVPHGDVDVVVEPTVGSGSFVASAPPELGRCSWRCFDISPDYVVRSEAVAASRGWCDVVVEARDAFTLMPADFGDLRGASRALAIGNPPWVTNSAQGVRDSKNLPVKLNRAGLSGLQALTGYSNFDIAEAILLRLHEALRRFDEVRFAFLLKRSVALKMARALLHRSEFSDFSFSRIDAKREFGVGVEAGLLQFQFSRAPQRRSTTLALSSNLGAPAETYAGPVNGRWVNDLDAYSPVAWLEAPRQNALHWRQGVKHDAARILEFVETRSGLVNGYGEPVDVEEDVLCPLYKSSDVAAGRRPTRWFPLYQTDLRGPPLDLEHRWPKLAEYLTRHHEALAARKSRIYERKPPFMLFGVGDYTHAKFKVAVSGLYKQPRFRVLEPTASAPPVVDDTCYLLPCDTVDQAMGLAEYLNGDEVQRFLRAITAHDAKRPYTKDCLGRIRLPDWGLALPEGQLALAP